MIGEIIGQRLSNLRKHLSFRLGEELPVEEVASRCGLNLQQVYRLEHGMKGSPDSLVCLLLFYRRHGYNLDWILTEENDKLPMVIPTGTELLAVGHQLKEFNRVLKEQCQTLNVQLRRMGYEPLDAQILSFAGDQAALMPDPL